MKYIIVWRHGCKDPFVSMDGRQFIEEFDSFEEAKKEADKIEKEENEGSQSPWYFDYEIYKKQS
jgi:hypothetical protein